MCISINAYASLLCKQSWFYEGIWSVQIVRIPQKSSQAPANVNIPRIARALSFKPIWNVRAAFIGWKVSVKKACVKIHIVWHAIKIYNICICIHRVSTKTAQIPWKIRSNTLENLTHYYLLTCCIVVNVAVWEIGREKQAAGQSRAPGRVMWTKCLPRDTIQPMEYTLRNSNEIICKHRKLPLQVPEKVFGESGQSVVCRDGLKHVLLLLENLQDTVNNRNLKYIVNSCFWP